MGLPHNFFLTTGAKIDSFMRTFIDERDAGSLILTHLYLLVGCAAPVWLYTPSKASQGTSAEIESTYFL